MFRVLPERVFFPCLYLTFSPFIICIFSQMGICKCLGKYKHNTTRTYRNDVPAHPLFLSHIPIPAGWPD